MARVELIMPKMGESITEATILKWLKKPGDKIEPEESVLEVATDKVDTEVPSTHGGILKEILAKEGEVVKVGKPIAILSADVEEESQKSNDTPAPVKAAKVAVPSAPQVTNGSGESHGADYKTSTRFYSPLVKNIAKEEKVL